MQNVKNIIIFQGPVTALAIAILLAGNLYFFMHGHSLQQRLDRIRHTMDTEINAFEQRQQLHTNERAFVPFTGDTVLLLTPADTKSLWPCWNILHKTPDGFYQREELPEMVIKKITPADDDTAQLSK